MATKQAAEYMTQVVMPSNRKAGCTCDYDQDKYQAGEWSHNKGCASPQIECLPNVKALLALAGRV